MLANPFTKWVWDNRRSVIGWSVAVAAVGGVYAAFWPTVDNEAMRDALDAYPDFMLQAMNFDDIATAAGYLTASVYGLVVGVLVIVYAVSTGAKAIAGDEEAGTLDLILAHPVSRTRLALQRFAGFGVAAAALSLALLIVILALVVPASLDGISFGNFLAMHLHLFMFTVFFGALSFAAGAATGRRAVAVGVGAMMGVFGFAADGILPQVEALEWTQDLSPFQWLSGGAPLQNGVQIGDILLMAGLAALLVAIGTWSFGRRDVAV